MGTRARKERKRAGLPHVKPVKVPTMPYVERGEVPSLGLMSRAEVLFRMVMRR